MGITRTAVSVAVLLLALLAPVTAVAAVPAATAPPTVTTGPVDARTLQTTFQSLRPGSVLRLQPGRYEIGRFAPLLAQATQERPVRVVAADPSRPPELRGVFVLRDAQYWQLSGLRFVATVPDEPALRVVGGHGWAVTDSEMTGAAQTRDFANVAIDSNRTTKKPPTAWRFAGNCVHSAATRPSGSSAGYHNVYINAEGGGSGGYFGRNLLFGAPGGSNLKIGAGGDATVVGPAGIRIENNTMYDASQQVLVFGTVNGIMIRKNLLIRSRGGTSVNAGVYLHSITADGRTRVLVEDNYGFLMAGRPLFALSSPARSFTAARNFEGPDPRIVSGCGRLRPATAAATSYGRYGVAP